MKKWLVALSVLCVFCLVGYAQAGPISRSLVGFVHTDEVIVIPESGSYLMFNEQNGIEYYRWTVKEKEEFCEDLGLVDGTVVTKTKDITSSKHGSSHVFSAPSTTTGVVGEYRDYFDHPIHNWGPWTSAILIPAGESNHWKFSGGNHGEYRNVIATYTETENACSDAWAKADCRYAESGEGTELPNGLEPEDFPLPPSCDPQASCYNVDSDTMFFTKDVSIGYGVAGSEVPIEVLVYNACLGDTVQVKGAGHTFKVMESIKVRFLVFKLADINPNVDPKVMLNTGWFDVPVNVDGTFETELEGGYTFGPLPQRDGTGAYRFTFQVKKPDGTIGRTKSKVIVHDCKIPE